MKNRIFFLKTNWCYNFIFILFLFILACNPSPSKMITFTIYQNQKQFSNEEIGVCPMVNDQIVDSILLGFSKTDENGFATIKFHPMKYEEFALVLHSKKSNIWLTKKDGKELSFKCSVNEESCDLGDMVFQNFAFILK